jgi:hypothetical protein
MMIRTKVSQVSIISDSDDRGGAETKPKSVGPIQVPYCIV